MIGLLRKNRIAFDNKTFLCNECAKEAISRELAKRNAANGTWIDKFHSVVNITIAKCIVCDSTESNLKLTRRQVQDRLENVLESQDFRLGEKWLDSFLIMIYADIGDTDRLYAAGKAVRSLGWTLTSIAVGYDYNSKAFTYYLKQN